MTRRLWIVIGAGVVAAAATYVTAIRPWTMRWGATDEEVARRLPGDTLLPDSGYRATRAITIHARPEHVWPWIVQMGSGRAGWYALDLLDNKSVPSAIEILPEFQDLRLGDLIPMAVGKDIGPRVREMEPNRRMLWVTEGEFTWEWVLEPIDESSTRLISRIHEPYPPVFSRRMLYAVAASVGDIVMERRQLLGIKERAERTAQESRRQAGEG
jgi:hypothetical protein